MKADKYTDTFKSLGISLYEAGAEHNFSIHLNAHYPPSVSGSQYEFELFNSKSQIVWTGTQQELVEIVLEHVKKQQDEAILR